MSDEELDKFLWQAHQALELTASRPPVESVEAHMHLIGCSACSARYVALEAAQRRLEELRQTALTNVRSRDPLAKPDSCPSEAEWPRMAAGMPGSDAELYLEHAALCDYCGPLLRQAVVDFNEHLTFEERKSISELHTANAEAKAGLAGRISGRSETQDFHWSHTGKGRVAVSLSRPLVMGFSVGILLAATAITLWLVRPESPERLLAIAYYRHRTLEMRLPGVKYSPLIVERGASSSDFDGSPELLRSEAQIGEALKAHPDSPRWLRAKGEADLLDSNPTAAQTSLEQAHILAPGDESISLDLANCYFLIAETQGKTQPYLAAVSLLREITKEHPENADAWFNLAVALERMGSSLDAVEAWNIYLQHDSTSEWTKEATTRRDELQRRNHLK